MAEQTSPGFERMDPVDALLHRGDGDPGSRSTMLGLYILDECPDWDRVLETFDPERANARRANRKDLLRLKTLAEQRP